MWWNVKALPRDDDAARFGRPGVVGRMKSDGLVGEVEGDQQLI